jgi:hypothetical protein
MLAALTSEELSAGLDVVTAELLDAAGLSGPPVDAAAVATALGIAVATDDGQQGRGRYVRLRGIRGRSPRPTILLRPEPRPERRQWALAHEIGEHVAHRVFARLGADPREAAPTARERVACQLAGRLLLPTAWFARDGASCRWDLLALKARYSTASHELIARRMLEQAEPAIVTIFDQGQLHLRQSNVPGRVQPPSRYEVQCWEVVHRTNRPEEVRRGMTAIRGWPVHEEGWIREILRTEVEVECQMPNDE